MRHSGFLNNFSGSSPGLVLGINGQPTQHAAYMQGISYPQQVVFAQQMGANRYRTTITAADDGELTSQRINQLFNTTGNQDTNGIVYQLKAVGIDMIPLINDRLYYDVPNNVSPLWEASDQECYDAGYAIGFGFVDKYGHHFGNHLYELGNEIELFRNGTVNPPGDTPDDYRENFLDTVAHYISGMNDGVKTADPLAKTIFNTSGYWKIALWDIVFDTVLTYDHDIDYCGVHWYNHSAGAANGNLGFRFPTEYLHNRYGKQIAYTEFGWAYNASDGKTTNHNNDLTFFNECWAHMTANQDKIVIAHRHELVDRPNMQTGTYNGEENNYGLIWWDGFPDDGFSQPTLKPLAVQLGLSL